MSSKKQKRPSSIGHSMSLLGLTIVVTLGVVTPHPEAEAAPPCPFRYTDAAGVVTDHDTGLEWQQTVENVARTWAQANSYCQTLPLDGGGFRLPTSVELQTLFDDTVSQPPYLDASVFYGANLLLWTGDPVVSVPGAAWAIDFDVDGNGDYVKVSAMGSGNRVRCVR